MLRTAFRDSGPIVQLIGRTVQKAHSVQIVVDHELQHVRHVHFVRLKYTPQDGAVLQQRANASHQSRVVQVDLEELMGFLVVAVEGAAEVFFLVSDHKSN